MRLTILTLLACTGLAVADTPEVPNSLSPDGKAHAVMDIDRDPKISPEWKGDSFPQIEVTQKDTGRVLASIEYFGAAGDDARPLREHVRVSWRPDSKAFAVIIDDRFYSHTKIFALVKNSKFVEVAFPSYQAMTGYPAPDSDQLRPRGRSTVEGWDSKGRLIYSIFMRPLPSYSGDDPLEHKILLEVSPDGMILAKKTKAEQAGAGQPATRAELDPEGGDKPQTKSVGHSR
ncbi:hypothetical protein JIN85_20060 [Luteolibacter pohnpeiensis]|uniref:Uncharacterized protein n=1 Tax=Luteolibacter pohnpeiensis TaxID=454153 RepID=A0A934S9Q4_9BACT|nr:hypothetical protein [Luteolibacter pohnpeiensis]MBK1884717.1 hypothetical protein [Luteolibacter pohnpeiensis]